MDRAVERMERALAGNEYIAVYGDYDVDGITSTCLLTRFLSARGARVLPYIPDRLEEGYGLNREAVELLADKGVTLIVTVDCGITAVEEARYAASLGLDVIITDHHECKDELPQAVAVVDPHRRDCGYPFPCLAGVGVALKLALALTPGPERERVLSEYADLAAIGTVADVMQLSGENRAIVRRGLQALAQTRRPGLRGLIREAGAEGKALTAPASASPWRPASTRRAAWAALPWRRSCSSRRTPGGRRRSPMRCAPSTGSASPSRGISMRSAWPGWSGRVPDSGAPSYSPARAGTRAWLASWPPVWRRNTPAPHS